MRAAAFFSGGKESVFAVYKCLKEGVEVDYLIMNFFEFPRPSPHTENASMVRAIAELLGIPLVEVRLEAGREKEKLRAVLSELGVDALVAGDILLEEHRRWHSDLVEPLGLELLEPLWLGDPSKTRMLAEEELAAGLVPVVMGVNLRKFSEGEKWLGRKLDEAAIEELARLGIDPCGEHGEYHTLVVDAPIFRGKIELLDFERKIKDYHALLVVREFKISGRSPRDQA